MIFIPTYQEAINRKNKFLNSGLCEYSKLRNYDYGPEERENVSGLSPYISHGLIDIVGLAQECIDLFGEKRAEKYIAELFWGVYWKGYLELRPSIWTCFKNDLENLRDYQNEELYLKAINGETNISCFNDWVKELREYNYLHNHTRMWFASIWIFTLKLPWQLGAAFFMKHLYDGDLASNTLSWRWVAGIHTINKAYFASAENIKKYSSKIVEKSLLSSDNRSISEDTKHEIIPKNFDSPVINNYEILLVFENSFGLKEFNDYASKFKEIYVVNLGNELRSIKLDKKVINFKRRLEGDFVNRLSDRYKIKLINLNELDNRFSGASAFYPNTGDIYDYTKELDLNFIYSNIDTLCWGKCKAGFFSFKKFIFEIIEKLKSAS